MTDPGMPSNRIRVLIVDDSDIVRGAIRALLQEENGHYEAHDSCEPEEALKKAHKIQPEVILLDLSLPGVSGMELAKRMRTELPGSKIVVMSAQDPLVLQKLTELAGLELCLAKTELSAELLPLLAKIAPA
jgi:DNA-binding NarL/FixJ family response regulator